MSRKKNLPPVKTTTPPGAAHATSGRSPSDRPFSKQALPAYANPLYAALLLALVAVALYINSISNEYALDDIISITGNSFTKKGLGGIVDLINKDSFYGFIGSASELSGGRWRPLALITFATEWEFAPESPHLSHFINVLLYGLTAFVMFWFVFRYVFKNNLHASFATTLLFAMHPVHTEVVANIKSRDELLSLLLLLSSLWLLMRHAYNKKMSLLTGSVVLFFLALLSKENGLTFIAIIPVTLFVFANYSWRNALLKSLPFAVVAVLYLLLRFSVIGFVQKSGGIQEVMNAPFLFATAAEALATKALVLGLYIRLLFFPHPLAYDYSYNQIPYVDFANAWVWVSIVVQLALLVFAFANIGKRNILAYGILFYFFSIFIVSNLVIDIGGVMGERFLYQPSFGFAIALVACAQMLFNRFNVEANTRSYVGAASLLLLLIPAAAKTIDRNKDWENDKTLFVADVYTVPNSARAQNGAGTAFILLSDDFKKDTVKQLALLDSSILHLHKALKIHPEYVDPYLNLGTAYNRLGDLRGMEDSWNEARRRNPTHPKLGEYDRVLSTMLLQRGLVEGQTKNYDSTIYFIRKAVRYNPDNADAWYNLGGVWFTVQKTDSAAYAFQQALRIDPNHKQAQSGHQAAAGLLRQQGRNVPQ